MYSMVLNNKSIAGISVSNIRYKITQFTLLGKQFPVDLENIVNLNYHIALGKIKKLFNAGKRHNLTPIEKITVG